MNRIRLLPEQVANQIAAGEVVERPASVVKELVENSLDAKAARITVEIRAGGRSLIRVTDDGLGMSRDDALLCLERHATSKIRLAEDLTSIQSFGFRGEAIPSIASVSRFTLTTGERDSGAIESTRIVVHGGRIVEVKSAPAAPGTEVEVRQIFFNLPARRKFLRSEETERAHIQHRLVLSALAHPEVGFEFIHDQRRMWQVAGVPRDDRPGWELRALTERMHDLYGGDTRMLPVEYSAEIQPPPGFVLEPGEEEEAGATRVRIWGLIGAPGVARSTREEQHVFVNRRPVENRGINFAMLEGYHTALMRGRYPVCALFVEIDPAQVDVNIHPAKREVKFHREQQVRDAVTQAIRRTLMAFHTRSGSPVARPEPGILRGEGIQSASQSELPDVQADRSAASASGIGAGPEVSRGTAWSGAGVARPAPLGPVEPVRARAAAATSGLPAAETRRLGGVGEAPGASRGVEGVPAVETRPSGLLSVPLRVVGVVGRLYVVLESDCGMVLMDQHAAHERILYEQMLRRLETGPAPSQRLLLPETVELPVRDAQFIRENLEVLSRLGVGLSEFGERTFLLDGLPPFVRAKDSRRFVLELVDELKAAGAGVNTLRLGEQMIAKTVCRHAVKANDPLGGEELENLVEDLRRCEMPYTCPHGRPTLIEMNYAELERKFGRVQ